MNTRALTGGARNCGCISDLLASHPSHIRALFTQAVVKNASLYQLQTHLALVTFSPAAPTTRNGRAAPRRGERARLRSKLAALEAWFDKCWFISAQHGMTVLVGLLPAVRSLACMCATGAAISA